MICEILTQSTT